MKNGDALKKISETIAEINRKDTLTICEEALKAGISPKKVLHSLSEGMTIIGERFGTGEAFISEIIMAGVILKDAQEIIKPYIKLEQISATGKVLIGTVKGDLHDIGKNIVISLLESSGFEVIDLGVDVAEEEFISAVRENKPDVLGLSALLRTTVPEMTKIIDALGKTGLREKIKVIVGGLPLNDEYAKNIGADYYAKDAWRGLKIIRKLVEI
jgi:methylmalonyl-CoA mutase cobalamin-binding domain/chain